MAGVGAPEQHAPTRPADAVASDNLGAAAEAWPLIPVRLDGLPTIGLDRSSPRWIAVVESLTGAPHPLRLPVAVAVDRLGHRYVVDAGHHRLQVFDRDGHSLMRWGGEGDAAGEFRFRARHRCDDTGAECVPVVGGGVAVAEPDRVYVADYGNHRVQAFDRHGRFLAGWGSFGGGPGEFALPHGIAVDGAGRVYVTDLQNHRVQQFDGEGRFLAQWGGAGTAVGRFIRPGGLAIDGDGHVYVADTGNQRVQVFDRPGHLVAWWPIAALGDDAPVAGIALDRDGHVFVGGSTDLIQQFDRTGRALLAWSGSSGEPGQRCGPAGLAVDADGDVYVADRNNHRLLRFRLLLPVTG